MFDGLTVAESVLFKSNTRETLFRKPIRSGLPRGAGLMSKHYCVS